jgi:3-phenylpropionate/trans-cinnamate dioxygenase ferredoxin reductase subunit
VSDRKTFVIVGGGLAGAKAAEILRLEGFDGRVVLVADEPHLPYERPPLSKGYLAGDSTVADAQVHDESFYASQAVELLTGTRATGLDTSARRLSLSGGGVLTYDSLLIATGAIPRRPPIEGVDGDHVFVLRSLTDADMLRAAVGGGGRLVTIGAGWIGCEVAATARGLGAEVTIVERAGAPLERVLGPQLGRFFADIHSDNGVELLTNTGVAGIAHGGRRVRLADGRTLDCDAVLVAVGVTPETALGDAAGLAIADGIVADQRLRTTAPGDFVAGDVASVMHPRYGRHVRVEHWDTAQAQGAAAARSMLSKGEPYARAPYFFSDQYDLGLEYVGLHDPGDELVIRGSFEDGRFQAFWIGPDATVSAGMHINDWDAIETIRTLVERRTPVDKTRIVDPDHPLGDEQPVTGKN